MSEGVHRYILYLNRAILLAMAVVGAVSAKWTIFVIQGVPALIALAAVLLS